MPVREAVSTPAAPAAIGPYSQAIKSAGFVFVSGQIALDPVTGTLVSGGIAEETEGVLKNLGSILEAAGSSIDRVVKTTVYLVNLDDFAAMNTVYERYFRSLPPARATVQAARLPRGARVEIDAIAVAG